jgi:cytoskeletal protein RodZ
LDEIGSLFRETRESSGVSIEEASKDLNISELILTNIEEGKTGAFKDVYELKNNVVNYAKYLGLDEKKIIDEFNEYVFEYTSKIPVKELEKTIEMQVKQDDNKNKIVSPYTSQKKKINKWYFAILYILILLLIIVALVWSIKQVTIGSKETTVISYRK